MLIRDLQAVVFEVTRWLALATMIGVMAPITGLSRAAAQEPVTVTGEIVDLSCYLSQGSKGKRHKQCAVLCAKKGLPIGVLDDGGNVFLLIEDHDAPESYDAAKKLAGERAKVSGKQFSKGGVQAVLIAEITKE